MNIEKLYSLSRSRVKDRIVYVGVYVGWIPKKKPKLSFLKETRKNDNQHEFPGLNEFTLYMIFEIFNEKSHSWNGHSQENNEIHM